MKKLHTLQETIEKIKAGEKLVIAGVEELLKQLPTGNWIGGTIPYFMGDEGGVYSTELLLIEKLPDYVENIMIKQYTDKTISLFAKDEFTNGFSVILIPAFSKIHEEYAKNSNNYQNIFDIPIIGWITGVPLDLIGKQSPKIFNGTNSEFSDCEAVVMHVELPSTKYAVIDIVNVFKQDEGDVITFSESGFSATECNVNGKMINLAKYLKDNQVDTKLPLVANYYETMINVSFQSVSEDKVTFYAPVFKDVEYKIAAPVANYVNSFASIVEAVDIKPDFSCNCILNFLYAELEGKKTADITGAITFGEIAYQLLNQTMVYLSIREH